MQCRSCSVLQWSRVRPVRCRRHGRWSAERGGLKMAVLLALFELLKAYLEQGFKIPGGRGLLKHTEFVGRSRSGQLWLLATSSCPGISVWEFYAVICVQSSRGWKKNPTEFCRTTHGCKVDCYGLLARHLAHKCVQCRRRLTSFIVQFHDG